MKSGAWDRRSVGNALCSRRLKTLINVDLEQKRLEAREIASISPLILIFLTPLLSPTASLLDLLLALLTLLGHGSARGAQFHLKYRPLGDEGIATDPELHTCPAVLSCRGTCVEHESLRTGSVALSNQPRVYIFDLFCLAQTGQPLVCLVRSLSCSSNHIILAFLVVYPHRNTYLSWSQ